jgi:hypothetical protein
MLKQSVLTTSGVPLPNGESRRLALVAQASVELRETLLKQRDILWIGRLQLPQILLVDVSHLAALDGFEKFNESISLLVPVLRAHNDAPPVNGNTRSEVS